VDHELFAFVKRLVAFRAAHPVFRRRRFLSGVEASQLGWYTHSGVVMMTADWADHNARSLAIYLDGVDDPDRGGDGRPLVDDDFLVLVNGSASHWSRRGESIGYCRQNAVAARWCGGGSAGDHQAELPFRVPQGRGPPAP
jgi:pullulanase/glycogen debranching enzyme